MHAHGLAAWLLAACAASVAAQAPDPTHRSGAPPAADAALGPPLASEALAQLRGGAATRNDMALDGTTAGNTAQQVSTGHNTITEGAFSGLSGIPVVIQNTGANVLIQNAVIINLQME